MHQRDELNRKRRGPRGGFTLVEVIVSMLVLAVAGAGSLASLVSGMHVREVNRETALAQFAARSAMESLRLTSFRDIFATYNTSPGDDPGGAGSAPGEGFAVAGLDPQTGDPDGLVGRYVFPSIVGDDPEALRENVPDPTLGMPRDLFGDGLVDGADYRATYNLLPVRVVVEWRSAKGHDRSIQFETCLTQR